MSLKEIIDCAPFRLPAPRPLTPYEWSVVEQAIAAGAAGATGGYSEGTTYDAKVLAGTIAGQRQCPNWTHSNFGPAPAVSKYAYMCLGAWFAPMDAASKQRALNDMAFAGLLCRPSVPWGGCRQRSYSSYTDWEGGEQRGRLAAGAEPCAWPRYRTTYAPMTGAEMLTMWKTLCGGKLPAELEQAVRMSGPAFADRSFLVGVQLRAPTQDILGVVAQARTMQEAMDAAIEEAALIWAPGRGMSIRNMMLSGQVDYQAMVTLLTELLPLTWGDWMQQLPQVIPGLLPGLLPGGVIPPSLFGFLGGTSHASPGAQDVGMSVTDDVGSSLDHTNPLTGQDTNGDAGKWMAAALAFGIVATVGGIYLWEQSR